MTSYESVRRGQRGCQGWVDAQVKAAQVIQEKLLVKSVGVYCLPRRVPNPIHNPNPISHSPPGAILSPIYHGRQS